MLCSTIKLYITLFKMSSLLLKFIYRISRIDFGAIFLTIAMLDL